MKPKVLTFLLAVGLFFGGLVVLLFLKRVPLQLRIAMGLVDVIASLVLFTMLRQWGANERDGK